MAPFRPTNLNKRAYPGNASVIGPTVATSLGITTTTCCSSTNTCGACTGPIINLGCRCTFCAYPCCNICCSCNCAVCTPIIPSGMWNTSEAYEAKSRNAWGDSTCSASAATCLCCTNIGYTCTTNQSDCKGFFICCGPSTNKWFVAPSCTEVSRTFTSRSDSVTVANSCMGSCDWFVPTIGQAYNPGYTCRSYWDSYNCVEYWSNTTYPPGSHGYFIDMNTGGQYSWHRRGGAEPGRTGYSHCVRSFRCTVS